MQIPLFKPQTEWLPPEEFPDLSKYDEIADKIQLDDDIVEAGLIVAEEIDTISGEYGYIWFGYDFFSFGLKDLTF